ncbi:MAG: hypothetical protein HOO96_43525 [Polyangiaceae bacterium]|nr:hypothetical protein [Polyangiaceae bacterium]
MVGVGAGVVELLARVDRCEGRGNLAALDAAGEELGYVRVLDGRVVFAHAPRAFPPPSTRAKRAEETLTESDILALVASADFEEAATAYSLHEAQEVRLESDAAAHFELTLNAVLALAAEAATYAFRPKYRQELLPWSISTDALLLAITTRRHAQLVRDAQAIVEAVGSSEDVDWWVFCTGDATTLCHVSRPGIRSASDYMRANAAALPLLARSERFARMVGGLWWHLDGRNLIIRPEGPLCIVLETTDRALLKRLLDRMRRVGAATLRPVEARGAKQMIRRISSEFHLPGSVRNPNGEDPGGGND